VSFSGFKGIYMGFLKERQVHLNKCEILRSYSRLGVARVCM
jgi:hypothetical protein